jgi:hypothetical protein
MNFRNHTLLLSLVGACALPPNQNPTPETVATPLVSDEESSSAPGAVSTSETASSSEPVQAAPSPPPDNLVPRPIVFDEERVALTLQYLQAHSDPEIDLENPSGTFMEPHVVVLHWTATPTADSAWQIFNPARLRGRASLQGAGALNVSAHFIVDRDGTPYQLMESNRVGRHTIGLNHTSIGIENVGDDKQWPLTEAQIATNISLIRWFASEYEITHVIGHHEYRSMEGLSLFRELDDSYRTRKVDPGEVFVQAVWEGVQDLDIGRAPNTPVTSE